MAAPNSVGRGGRQDDRDFFLKNSATARENKLWTVEAKSDAAEPWVWHHGGRVAVECEPHRGLH